MANENPPAPGPAAEVKPPRKRISALVYGAPKTGGTLGLIKAVVNTGFLLTRNDGLDVAAHIGMLNAVSKRSKRVTTINEVCDYIDELYKKGIRKFGIDEWSLISDGTMAECEKKNTSSNKFATLNMYNAAIDRFIRTMETYADADFIVRAHEQDPKMKRRTAKSGAEQDLGMMDGTVLMAGWLWPEKFPACFSIVAHIEEQPSLPGWKYGYCSRRQGDWIAGDRFSVLPPVCPQNFGEIFRQLGDNIPYPAPWMDKVVTAIAEALREAKKNNPDSEVNYKEIVQQVPHVIKVMGEPGTFQPEFVRWAIQDGIDRFIIQSYNRNMVANFIDSL